jgi:hypothetical protein
MARLTAWQQILPVALHSASPYLSHTHTAAPSSKSPPLITSTSPPPHPPPCTPPFQGFADNAAVGFEVQLQQFLAPMMGGARSTPHPPNFVGGGGGGGRLRGALRAPRRLLFVGVFTARRCPRQPGCPPVPAPTSPPPPAQRSLG